jgi:lipoprotein-anchoring transpeptidase ErfK/SrfK
VARSNRSGSKTRRGSGKLAALFVLLCLIGVGVWLALKYQPLLTAKRPSTRPRNSPLPTPTNAVVKTPRTTNTVVIPTAPLPATNTVVAQPTRLVTNLPPVRAETPGTNDHIFPRPPRNILEAQIALARQVISSGSIDGANGSQTRAALMAFQRRERLPETLELDATTRSALMLSSQPNTNYLITATDLARLQPVEKTWLGKSQQSALDYESILELVAERGHASPNLIRRLNPGIDWTNLTANTEVVIPAVDYPKPASKAGFILISLGAKKLQAFDAATNLIAHFPCSIAARVEKRPAGELKVTAIAENPNYTFNPEVFPESAEGRELGRKLILPPGPNNPVGTAWISLDLPGYGIHGTPSPEQVGRTESHGCFRLANWNASYLVKLVWIGMPVYIEP